MRRLPARHIRSSLSRGPPRNCSCAIRGANFSRRRPGRERSRADGNRQIVLHDECLKWRGGTACSIRHARVVDGRASSPRPYTEFRQSRLRDPASGRGGEFTQPRAHSLAQVCIYREERKEFGNPLPRLHQDSRHFGPTFKDCSV